jgi:hypothetical protein
MEAFPTRFFAREALLEQGFTSFEIELQILIYPSEVIVGDCHYSGLLPFVVLEMRFSISTVGSLCGLLEHIIILLYSTTIES